MKPITRVAATLLAIVAALAIAAVAFIYSGAYNVAATSGHTKPVETIFRTLMMRSVVSHARQIIPPANFDPRDRALAERAAGHYEMMCRTCHGAPGKKPDPWQLYPPPPDLADALRVMRWSDAEVFWITKNGIKDTGMSAFGGSHSDEDLWALTALIRQLQAITPEEYKAMSERAVAKQKEGAHQPTGVPSGHEGQKKAEGQKVGGQKTEQGPPHKH